MKSSINFWGKGNETLYSKQFSSHKKDYCFFLFPDFWFLGVNHRFSKRDFWYWNGLYLWRNESTSVNEQKISETLTVFIPIENSKVLRPLSWRMENEGFSNLMPWSKKPFRSMELGDKLWFFLWKSSLWCKYRILDLLEFCFRKTHLWSLYYLADLLISSLAKFTKIGIISVFKTIAISWRNIQNPERTYVNILKTGDVSGADLSDMEFLFSRI